MMIARKLYQTVLNNLVLFPAMALLDPWQVGKTTLAEEIAAGVEAVWLAEMVGRE